MGRLMRNIKLSFRVSVYPGYIFIPQSAFKPVGRRQLCSLQSLRGVGRASHDEGGKDAMLELAEFCLIGLFAVN